MIVFNDYLYLGLRDTRRGYAVVKTKAGGAPPYTFTPVITAGAFLTPPSQSVINMQIYKGQLYVGTDRPAELIRINPDDSWDLVIGTPRQTPTGWRYPISGLDAGFFNWLNGHIWRMETYQDRLYLGTMNMGTHFRHMPEAGSILEPNCGFDLFETANGCHYTPVTTTGFGDKFNFGLRSFAVTPQGLFVGTANSCYGLQIWRGQADPPESRPARAGQGASQPGVRPAAPPARLEIEVENQTSILSWDRPTGVIRFHILRATISNERRRVESNKVLAPLLRILRKFLHHKPQLYLPPLPDRLWIPGAYSPVGSTEQNYFTDPAPSPEEYYLYYVQAENEQGQRSGPSNIAAAPPLTDPVTFAGLSTALAQYQATAHLAQQLDLLEAQIKAGAAPDGVFRLSALLDEIAAGQLTPAQAEAIRVALTKLKRRVTLCQADLISRQNL